MKLYLVSYEYGECQEVFSSVGRAKAWAEENANFTGWPKHCWISEKDLDAGKGDTILVQYPTETERVADPIHRYEIRGIAGDKVIEFHQGFHKREIEEANFNLIKSVATYTRIQWLKELGTLLFADEPSPTPKPETPSEEYERLWGWEQTKCEKLIRSGRHPLYCTLTVGHEGECWSSLRAC